VDEDASGLTFEEWDPAQAFDKLCRSQPAPMIINSSQLRAACFKLDTVIPPQLEAAARNGMRTRGAGLRQLRGMGSEYGRASSMRMVCPKGLQTTLFAAAGNTLVTFS
jgi:hypothetical protein